MKWKEKILSLEIGDRFEFDINDRFTVATLAKRHGAKKEPKREFTIKQFGYKKAYCQRVKLKKEKKLIPLKEYYEKYGLESVDFKMLDYTFPQNNRI